MLAAGQDGLGGDALVRDAAVLLRQEVHGEMHAGEVAAGDRQVTRLLRAARQEQRIVAVREVLRLHVDADIDAVMEGHALRLHLLDAAVDVALLHLEVGNPVAEQAAGAGVLLVEVDVMAGAGELLRGGEAGWPGADDADALAGLRLRRLGTTQPISQPLSMMAHSIDLMVTGVSSMFSVQAASQGAGQTRPVNSGKLLVECRLRSASSQSSW